MTARTTTDRSTRYDPATRKAGVTAGVLFLTATATFLAGDIVLAAYFSAPTGTGSTSALAVGVVLQAICAIAGAGVGFALRTVIVRHHEGLANGYAAFRCLEAVAIIGVGVYMLTTQSPVAHYELFIYGFTGVAGLMLSYVLLETRIAPAWLGWLGVVGYVAIVMAIPTTVFDIATLDSGVGQVLYVPGGLFELVLPVLLIAKGFRRTEPVRRAPDQSRVRSVARSVSASQRS